MRFEISQIGHVENIIYLILQISEGHFFLRIALLRVLSILYIKSLFADLEFGQVLSNFEERRLELIFHFLLFLIASTGGEYFALLFLTLALIFFQF